MADLNIQKNNVLSKEMGSNFAKMKQRENPEGFQMLPDMQEAAVANKARTLGEAREGAIAAMQQMDEAPAQRPEMAQQEAPVEHKPMTNADRNAAVLKEVLMRKRAGLPVE